jgi:hypothetical protein
MVFVLILPVLLTFETLPVAVLIDVIELSELSVLTVVLLVIVI